MSYEEGTPVKKPICMALGTGDQCIYLDKSCRSIEYCYYCGIPKMQGMCVDVEDVLDLGDTAS